MAIVSLKLPTILNGYDDDDGDHNDKDTETIKSSL